MKSLMPILAIAEHHYSDLCLLNPAFLKSSYDFDGPYTIANTKITIEQGEEWSIVLQDGDYCVILLSSSDIPPIKSNVIDVVAILGYQLTLSSWQKLYLHTDNRSADHLVFLLIQE